MEVEIRSTIFSPIEPGQPYLALASAFAPSNAFDMVRKAAHRSCQASTLQEAKQKCCELAALVKDYVQAQGHRVRSVCCTTCGTGD